MSNTDWWGDWRPNLPAHSGNLQPTDLIECTSIVGGLPVNTAITGQQIINAASSSGASWGGITGTLSNQTDLQSALNGKQTTLVSGTSIKTVNSTSLLGSGDVAVQPTLVSGTNIKTLNNNSLLGSGNISIISSPYLLSSTGNGGAVTGTTTNTISASGICTSTNFNNTQTLQFRAKLYKSAGTLATTFRLYINTANNLTGATLLATAASMTTAGTFQHFWRDFYMNGTSMYYYPSGTAAANDLSAFTASTFTITIGQSYYFLVTIQQSNTTDSAICLKYQVFNS